MKASIKPDLRISDKGVVFDPSTGESFTVNDSGLEILRCMSEGLDEDRIHERIAGLFDVTRLDFDRYYLDFVSVLKSHHLLVHEA